jgi:hypothetical protein
LLIKEGVSGRRGHGEEEMGKRGKIEKNLLLHFLLFKRP